MSDDKQRKGKTLGPGLRKSAALPLIETRERRFFRSHDYRWRELFEAADVVSEGATATEGKDTTYYGSTSILLPSESHGGQIPDRLTNELSALAEIDPHARIRAIRIACLEAQLRATAPIGRVKAEVYVRPDRRGVRVDVEVEAKVQPSPAGSYPKTKKPRRTG